MNLVLYRPKSTRLSRFLLFTLESAKLVDFPRTVNPLMQKLVDSFNRCTERGVLGRRFIVNELRGDQVWIRQLFQHKSVWNSISVCFRCNATTRPTNDNYTIYSAGSSCRRNTEAFVMDELPRELSPLAQSNLGLVIFHLVPVMKTCAPNLKA